MIVDSSALIAIVFKEPGFELLLDKILSAPRIGIATPTLVETTIVLAARLKRSAAPLVGRMVSELGIAAIPFSEAHWHEATDAYLRFGKGRHAARLNFGDCLSYAAARVAGQPLLFVGDDFGKTDVAVA